MHKKASPRECGKVKHFARFASASLEQLWGKLETRIPDAAAAVDRGDVFQHEQHVQTLKDVIALHLVRSLNYRDVHERIFTKIYTEQRKALLTDQSDLLRLAVLQQRGVPRRPASCPRPARTSPRASVPKRASHRASATSEPR
ncbi:hypothetical protein [Streptomyces yangpuensis]|uniref:hypothetical protein n=1 Tax=Streptomyces yangpuensis TaxID=1648182 RepID=UPI00364D880A